MYSMMTETTPEPKTDVKTSTPIFDSGDPLKSVKQEPQSSNGDVKSSNQPKSTTFAPYRGTGLLDRIAGFDRLFPEDSAREGDSAARQDDCGWRSPKTIKVKAKGAGSGRVGHVKEDEIAKDGRGDRQDESATFHSSEEPRPESRAISAEHNGIVFDGQQRRIRPRSTLRAWSSADGGFLGAYTSRTSPYKRLANSKRGVSKSNREYDKAEQDTRNATSGIAHQADPRLARVHMPLFAPSSNQITQHNLAPGSIQHHPPRALPHNARNPRDVDLLESLPYVDQGVRQAGAVDDSDEDDEIVFLGERRSFTTVDNTARSWSSMSGSTGYWVPVETKRSGHPTMAEKMNQIVQLLLVAAEVLDTDEIEGVKRESSESMFNSNNAMREAVSPAIPATLSPLYTLAKLSTKRIRTQGAKKHETQNQLTVANHTSSKKPASSVWIRGGHRSNNKDALTNKAKKPYDRPSKSTNKESTDSSSLHWHTDFPKFEMQAVERKRSISSRGSVLSGTASLSNMPPGMGKKVTFGDQVYEGKLPSKTESGSTEAKVLSRDRVEQRPATKGRPSSSSPGKRSRGRPRKNSVKVDEEAGHFETLRESRPKQEGRQKRVTTRSGRVVKAVQY